MAFNFTSVSTLFIGGRLCNFSVARANTFAHVEPYGFLMVIECFSAWHSRGLPAALEVPGSGFPKRGPDGERFEGKCFAMAGRLSKIQLIAKRTKWHFPKRNG